MMVRSILNDLVCRSGDLGPSAELCARSHVFKHEGLVLTFKSLSPVRITTSFLSLTVHPPIPRRSRTARATSSAL